MACRLSGATDLDGAHPLFELECGRISEARFLDLLRGNLEPILGQRPEMHRFSELYFEALEPNEPMIELMAGLRDRSYRMALLTNNVREWEPLWRRFFLGVLSTPFLFFVIAILYSVLILTIASRGRRSSFFDSF